MAGGDRLGQGATHPVSSSARKRRACRVRATDWRSAKASLLARTHQNACYGMENRDASTTEVLPKS